MKIAVPFNPLIFKEAVPVLIILPVIIVERQNYQNNKIYIFSINKN